MLYSALNSQLPRIAITSGEPAGIGPDICVLLSQLDIAADITVIGDSEVLKNRAQQLNIALDIVPYQISQGIQLHSKNQLKVLHIPTAKAVTAGILNPSNSIYVLNTLTCAIDGALSHAFDAIVTAPVHKGVINDAGIAFTGQINFVC